ncbi:MAG: enoyl-CoA hydratase-related protein [Planctomycetota bacterium]|nr:enoyl-CoA hydratase-related protein [Planctomycetota bacterium]
MEPISFQVDPSRYRHWEVNKDGQVMRILMSVDPAFPLREGYDLKLNSYDMGVDIELADIVRRLRFEHPEITSLVVSSSHEQVFCSGANIHMLGISSHSWKVNFCKFTNETRCELEDWAAQADVRSICAVTGPCAGGGYELALACDEIWLIDDGNSAVSLPETPLLGVLPGTGGLTRLVDKRMVRRDRADVFCTLAEGFKGKRALDWGLVDTVAPRSRFDDQLKQHLDQIEADRPGRLERKGIPLGPIEVSEVDGVRRSSTLSVAYKPEQRTAEITIEVPPVADAPTTPEQIHEAGDSFWPLRFTRELEDALLDLRVNRNGIGLALVRTKGNLDDIQGWDQILVENKGDWFVDQILYLMSHVIQRLERTSCSFFALIEQGSCFGGSMLEIALACDRIYMLDEKGVEVQRSKMNEGLLPMTTDITRCQCRLLGEPNLLEQTMGNYERLDASSAEKLGLVTEALDEFDYEDMVPVAIEERVSLSPDSLTGMEANLRFAGPENLESKIFGRLSAWQNWIFIRPNATGPSGALTLYGRPERPDFAWDRV